MGSPRSSPQTQDVNLEPLKDGGVEKVAVVEVEQRLHVAATKHDHVLLVGGGGVSSAGVWTGTLVRNE